MSDLDAFFAKKDRRKKKAKAAKLAPIPPPAQPSPATPAGAAAPMHPTPPLSAALREAGAEKEDVTETARPLKSDDGWIEIEDEQTAQVHTGGRTILELKRDEEKEESKTTEIKDVTEKFSGWQSKLDKEEPSEESPIVDEARFPTLAEAKDAPEVPTVKPGASQSDTRRPRIVNSRISMFKKLLQESSKDKKTSQSAQESSTSSTKAGSSLSSLQKKQLDESKAQGTRVGERKPIKLTGLQKLLEERAKQGRVVRP